LEGFDVLVIGSGTAGCMAAKTAASAGLKVCLVDCKPKAQIGNKVCGDGIGEHHLDHVRLAYPTGEELEREILGVNVHSPDIEKTFVVAGEGVRGFIVNRHLFGQRLLKDALDAGVILKDLTQVLKPIVKEGFVKGVIAKDVRSDNEYELTANAVVDGSGVSAVIRRNLPSEIGIETQVNKEDMIVCYREIRRLKEAFAEPEFCQIYLNLEVAPGGYYWIFPESDNKVNVGLGVVPSKNSPNPKEQLYDHILSKPLFEGSSIMHRGGGFVPTRRSLDSIVGNGVIVVGDAAYHVNPIHGGGMGPSMMAGTIAGETLTEAIGKGDLGASSLWPANLRYNEVYGAKQAGLDIFRIFLQGLSNEELNYGMRYSLIKEKDILRATMGEDIRLNITEKTRRVFSGLGRLSLIRKLYNMAHLSKRIKRLYQNYPRSPEGLPEWKNKVEDLIKEARTLFGPCI